MEKNINRPHKGMMEDMNPVDQPKETYRYALNAVNETTEGDRMNLSNENSNEECWELTLGYLPIGKVYTADGETIVLSTDGTNSEIGIVYECQYTMLINSQCLNFQITNQIDVIYRVRRGCERIVYWTDNLNPVRYLNIDKLENFYSDAYIAWLAAPSGSFIGEKWNCDLFELIPPYQIPCVSNAEIIFGGQLESGSYNFAIQLLDAGLNPTPWIVTSHPVNIYSDDTNEAFDIIEGSSNFESDALAGDSIFTNKAIKLILTNLDQDFLYYRVAVIKATGFQGRVTSVVASPEIVIDQDIFIFDGNLDGYTEISTEEIKVGKIDLERAAHIEQLENRLILSNTKGKNVNFCDFQRFASAIHSRYVIKEVDANDQTALGNPKNPLTSFECMGFMGGEVYAFGIVYIFNDGFESPVYHIPGPPPDQRWNWSTELCGVVDDTSVVTPWNSDIEHIWPVSQAATYNALPSDQKVQKWRVYETASNVTATEGQMAYWQCQNNVYPEIDSCVGTGDYWGQDICGNDLVGTPIRHHRFPSRTLEPHVNNNGSYTEVANLILEISLIDGQVWPGGTLTVTVDYDYNGVPQTQYTQNVNEADLPLRVIVDSQPGDVTVYTNIVIGGTVTSHPTVLSVTTSVINGGIVYNDGSTLRLLGVKFANVVYPHSDIVGHYFVRAKRDSFNRTILDSGIANRAREGSYAFDYITFSYFTNGNNSTNHHYLLAPRFMYYRDNLVPDYLKTELEFDFNSKYVGYENYDGVGGFIKEVDTLVEHRVQNYVGTVTTNGNKNHSKEKLLTSDALSYDDNYNTGNRQYNLSHSNRIQMIKLGSSLPQNGNDMPYVTLRVERDVHCNLDSIKYYKMHNCMYEGDIKAEIFGGDVYIAPFQISNTLLREFFQSALGAIIAAVLIVGAVVATVLTAGAAAPGIVAAGTALGVSLSAGAVASGIAITAIVAGAIGVTATAVRALFQAYDETDLDQMVTDSELDGLVVKIGSFLAYANEYLVGIYVESEVNPALRQSENHVCGEFYKNNQYINDYFRDRILYYDQTEDKWLGKGIVCPEIYHYNKDFSRRDEQKVYFPLSKTYDCCSDCLEAFPNRNYYSEQSFQEELSDNYRIILPNNYRDIEAEHGEITDIVRKGNNLYIMTKEALWHLPQSVQQQIVSEIITFIGSGEYFAIPPRKILDSDQGAAGTTHKWSVIKTPMGIFFFSDIEKAIYLLGGQGGLEKISSKGLHNWFFEYSTSFLANQYKRLTGEVFPLRDNHANPNGIGMHSTYDPRHERILFTKRDYKLLFQYESGFTIKTTPITDGVTGQIFYDSTNNQFAIATSATTFDPISLNDPQYFENKSFTLSFSLLTGAWISYHSYIPLFYYNTKDTFYSSIDNKLWKHNVKGSYQRFYGTLHSHIVETVSVSNPITTRLWEDIMLQTQAKKYDSTTDEFYDERFVTYNYITVYNTRQVSGELEMIVKDTQASPENYYSQQIVNNNTSIIIDRNERNWTINDFRDMRIDYTIPMFTKEWSSTQSSYPIDKVVNSTGIDINKDWFNQESFRDKYLIIRLRFANFDDVQLTTNFIIESEQQSTR